MKILLVNPGSSDDILARVMREIPYLDSPAFFAPHALAAVAAVTPAGYTVRIHDENMSGPVDPLLEREAFAVIGITLTTNQLRRTLAILESCRAMGLASRLVVGGIGAGTMVTRLQARVDTLFWGEVEDTWPEFLQDLSAGRPQAEYRRVAKPDMAQTPAPRWELIAADLPRYCLVSVQTARGCSFDCGFCDVIYTYGRKVRQKPIDRVLEEVRHVERLGARTVMFADDNFSADRVYVKELLRRLVPLNNAFALPLAFITQLDITIAEDDELLELLADANFMEVQIGIESTSAAALKDMNKHQNLRHDILAAVRKIQSYGLVVMAHMIIGADADDAGAFERTARFLREANITHHQCHPLVAPPGTRIWYDLKRQGRLIAFTDEMRDRLDITTNILPKQMTRLELMENLADYWERVHEPEDYTARALGFLQGIARRPRVKDARLAELRRNLRLMARTFAYFAFKVPARQRKAFFAVVRATQKVSPALIPRMIFVHTGYLMDSKRARHAAAVAREQAAFERAHPEAIQVLSRTTLIAAALREQMPAIARTAYGVIRRKATGPETLYRLTLEAVLDYHDRFGATLVDFDELQADRLQTACERVLAAFTPSPAAAGAAAILPDSPPAGFAREILDALDRAVHVAHGGWETTEGQAAGREA